MQFRFPGPKAETKLPSKQCCVFDKIVLLWECTKPLSHLKANEPEQLSHKLFWEVKPPDAVLEHSFRKLDILMKWHNDVQNRTRQFRTLNLLFYKTIDKCWRTCKLVSNYDNSLNLGGTVSERTLFNQGNLTTFFVCGTQKKSKMHMHHTRGREHHNIFVTALEGLWYTFKWKEFLCLLSTYCFDDVTRGWNQMDKFMQAYIFGRGIIKPLETKAPASHVVVALVFHADNSMSFLEM